MRRMRLGVLAAALALAVPGAGPAADAKVVVQYDCIPNYANWGGVTAASAAARFISSMVVGSFMPPSRRARVRFGAGEARAAG